MNGCVPVANSCFPLDRTPKQHAMLHTSLDCGEGAKIVESKNDELVYARSDISTAIEMVKFEINELAIELTRLVAVEQRLKNDNSLNFKIEFDDYAMNETVEPYTGNSKTYKSDIVFGNITREKLKADVFQAILDTKTLIYAKRETLKLYLGIETLTASIVDRSFFEDVENTSSPEPSKLKGLLKKALSICEGSGRVKPFTAEFGDAVTDGEELLDDEFDITG